MRFWPQKKISFKIVKIMNNFCIFNNLPESRAAQKNFYLMIVNNFFWCIFFCCLRFSALSILANVRLVPVVFRQVQETNCNQSNDRRSGSVPKLAQIFYFQKLFFPHKIMYSEQLLFLPFWPFFCLNFFRVIPDLL